MNSFHLQILFLDFLRSHRKREARAIVAVNKKVVKNQAYLGGTTKTAWPFRVWGSARRMANIPETRQFASLGIINTNKEMHNLNYAKQY